MDDLEGLDFNINIDSTQGINPDGNGQYVPVSQSWKENTNSATELSLMQPQVGSVGIQPVSLSSDQFNTSSFGEGLSGLFATARNPVACMFHIGFKAASITSFLFLNAIIGEEIITFVIVVLFAAFDFWTVKNITGRLLVNLRWHTEIDELGNEQWIYESDESKKALQAAATAGDPDAKRQLELLESQPGIKTDSWVFWSALYLTPIIWIFLTFIQFISLRFFWIITSSICLTLSWTNAQGYYYCQRDHKQRLSDYIQQRGMTVFMGAAKESGLISGAASRVMSGLAYLPGLFGRK